MDISIKEQEYLHALDMKKKRVRMNIVELIIWVALLVLCFNYLKTHPAEKTSIFAGIEVLTQKAQVFVSNVFGNKWDTLKDKYTLERRYKEVISTMEKWKCAEQDVIDEAKVRLESLKDLSASKFQEQQNAYKAYVSKVATKVSEDCGE